MKKDNNYLNNLIHVLKGFDNKSLVYLIGLCKSILKERKYNYEEN